MENNAELLKRCKLLLFLVKFKIAIIDLIASGKFDKSLQDKVWHQLDVCMSVVHSDDISMLSDEAKKLYEHSHHVEPLRIKYQNLEINSRKKMDYVMKKYLNF